MVLQRQRNLLKILLQDGSEQTMPPINLVVWCMRSMTWSSVEDLVAVVNTNTRYEYQLFFFSLLPEPRAKSSSYLLLLHRITAMHYNNFGRQWHIEGKNFHGIFTTFLNHLMTHKEFSQPWTWMAETSFLASHSELSLC